MFSPKLHNATLQNVMSELRLALADFTELHFQRLRQEDHMNPRAPFKPEIPKCHMHQLKYILMMKMGTIFLGGGEAR